MTIQEFAKALIFQGLEALGKYYSAYRGYVISNEDPENLGRVEVIVPAITKDKTHVKWAYPKNQFSGKNYGIQVLPQVGDIVWVEFETGNPRFPIWSHGHFITDGKPQEFATSQVYGFKTPKGQVIIIDDRFDIEKIIINHGENMGLVKVIPLTEKLNNLEIKVNDFLSHYKGHVHIDPLSGYTGVLMPPLTSPDTITIVPFDLTETEQSEIENTKVLH
jgi:hypothetical protein